MYYKNVAVLDLTPSSIETLMAGAGFISRGTHYLRIKRFWNVTRSNLLV